MADHVVLELEAIDRMYLNVYVPHLQTAGAVVGYLRVQHGQRFPSTTAVAPMTEAFVRNIERFVADEGIDLVAFVKRQRKDDVTQRYLRRWHQREGVLYVGKAQEKARVMRTERRCSRNTGGTYPWIVESTAMVNHYYFYCVDEDFGPFFLKFCSYFPYNAKLASTATSISSVSSPNAASGSSRSTTASSPVPTPRSCNAWPTACRTTRSIACCASGSNVCRIRFLPVIAPPDIATSSPSCRPSSRSPRCSINR
jgi:hypothetical protein